MLIRMEEERWYTVDQLAERWQLKPETIRRWIRLGDVRAMLLGDRRTGYRIHSDEVKRFEGERMGKLAKNE